MVFLLGKANRSQGLRGYIPPLPLQPIALGYVVCFVEDSDPLSPQIFHCKGVASKYFIRLGLAACLRNRAEGPHSSHGGAVQCMGHPAFFAGDCARKSERAANGVTPASQPFVSFLISNLIVASRTQ
jgi:hypothetical protein